MLDRARRRTASRLAAGLTAALGVVSGTAALVMLLAPDVLSGPPAMVGSARGTALVVLVTAVPLALAAIRPARRGSGLAVLVWLGALGLLAYNALMFLFATPLNGLFLLYVAWLALAAWSLGALVSETDAPRLASRFSPGAHRRVVAAYVVVVVGLNAAGWLARIVPALAHGRPHDLVRGTGVATSVVYIQDLALWLPLMAVVAVWLWRGQAWGFVLAAAGLVMWVLEALSVALDQAYGAAADPGATIVSVGLTPAFVVVAAVGLVPIALLLKGFDGEGLVVKARRTGPARPGRAASVGLAALAAAVAVSAGYGGVALARDGYGMPRHWLSGTPFTSWTVPGLLLLAGVALPHAVTAGAALRRSSWSGAAGLVCGLSLVFWIAVQLLVLQRFFWLQPVVVVLGLAEVWSVTRGQRRERSRRE